MKDEAEDYEEGCEDYERGSKKNHVAKIFKKKKKKKNEEKIKISDRFIALSLKDSKTKRGVSPMVTKRIY